MHREQACSLLACTIGVAPATTIRKNIKNKTFGKRDNPDLYFIENKRLELNQQYIGIICDFYVNLARKAHTNMV